jgi:hypothetical protein
MSEETDRNHREPRCAARFDDRLEFVAAAVSIKSHRAREHNPDRDQHRKNGDRFAPIAGLERVQISAAEHLRQCAGTGDRNRVGGRE